MDLTPQRLWAASLALLLTIALDVHFFLSDTTLFASPVSQHQDHHVSGLVSQT
jgi:energy-converting hydrogenase Eha subunit F